MSIGNNYLMQINDYFPSDKPVSVAVYYHTKGQRTEPISKYKSKEKYYRELIGKQPNWIYSGLYLDEGIKCRAQFNAMIADAKAGKFDLIITKNLSRFSRNIIDCIYLTRELLQLKRPVGIYFENEAFCTLCSQADAMINIISLMAISESENKHKHIGCVFPKRYPMDEE